MAGNYVLDLYQKLRRLPGGSSLFSRIFARKAPYFGSIRPHVEVLRPNHCEVRFKKRRAVQNHIGTVHVIAICNALEMAMGAMAEASIPPHLRWIPKGMTVRYLAKATDDIVAIAEVDPDVWTRSADVDVPVRAMRNDGTVVVEGTIALWVTPKPTKS